MTGAFFAGGGERLSLRALYIRYEKIVSFNRLTYGGNWLQQHIGRICDVSSKSLSPYEFLPFIMYNICIYYIYTYMVSV